MHSKKYLLERNKSPFFGNVIETRSNFLNTFETLIEILVRLVKHNPIRLRSVLVRINDISRLCLQSSVSGIFKKKANWTFIFRFLAAIGWAHQFTNLDLIVNRTVIAPHIPDRNVKNGMECAKLTK